MSNDLKNLQLTERDFQLMIDGLDALPKVGDAGSILSSLLLTMIAPDKESEQKVLELTKKRDALRDKDKTFLIEEIKILQGKLLLLKRHLRESGALDEFYGIVNEKKSDQ